MRVTTQAPHGISGTPGVTILETGIVAYDTTHTVSAVISPLVFDTATAFSVGVNKGNWRPT